MDDADDEYTGEEADQLRDALLLRVLKTPLRRKPKAESRPQAEPRWLLPEIANAAGRSQPRWIWSDNTPRVACALLIPSDR
jgi:hypothetical protein